MALAAGSKVVTVTPEHRQRPKTKHAVGSVKRRIHRAERLSMLANRLNDALTRSDTLDLVAELVPHEYRADFRGVLSDLVDEQYREGKEPEIVAQLVRDLLAEVLCPANEGDC